MKRENNIPLVSICLITYNQKLYVEKALNSILSQRVNFQWELIIADDCSNDGTQLIIQEYQRKYSDKIKILHREKNIGAANNWIELINSASAKYIAYLEGDDYWIDNYKLQKQVDFLEKRDDCSMCFTNNINVDNNDNLIKDKVVPNEFAKDLTHEDILSNNYFIGSGSALYRRDSIPNPLPNIFKKVVNGDYFIYAIITKNGLAGYIDINTLAYRLHNNGIWTKNSEAKKQWAMYSTFKIAKSIFFQPSEKVALKNNLRKILQNMSWIYLELPFQKRLVFTLKSLLFSLRYNILITWLKINWNIIKLYMKKIK